MKKRRRITQCPNCQTQLNRQENFCPNCGQENHFHNNSLKELWNDFAGSLWNFDGKIWRTLSTLFLKPGKVPKDYTQGKKVRYVPPIKLYLFSSFLFFLIFGFLQTYNASPQTLTRYNEFLINEKLYHDLNKEKDLDKKIDIILKNTPQAKGSSFSIKFMGKTTVRGNAYQKVISTRPFIQNILAEKIVFENDSVSYKMYIQIPEDKDSVTLANNAKISVETAKAIYYGRTTEDKLPKVSSTNDELSSFFVNNLLISSMFSHSFSDIENTMKTIIKLYSYTLILMLPFTGILLYIFFPKKLNKYYNSVIYAIFAHSHLLLVGFILVLFSILELAYTNNFIFFITNYFLPIAFLIYIVVYNIIAVKKFYKISYLRSILSSLLFYSTYILISVFLLLAIALIAFL